MNINGVGIVFNRGRGIKSLENALAEGWKKPENDCYKIPEEIFSDPVIMRNMRRADNLSKMTVLAALDALNDGGLLEEDKESLGIILATAFGPHPTTFKFLDDIIEYGDKNASPTTFSHSVHNAAISYASIIIQNRGPTLTITHFVESFYQALILAESWLIEERCKNILVGVADEYGEVMRYICNKKLNIARDGKIKPFLFSKTPEVVPGEGSVFFLISKTEKAKYASIKFSCEIDKGNEVDLCVLDSDGMTGSEEYYLKLTKNYNYFASYTPLFGSILTGSAFSCLVSVLMIKNQKIYASPVTYNPYKINLCDKTETRKLNIISCVKYDCSGEKIEFFVTK